MVNVEIINLEYELLKIFDDPKFQFDPGKHVYTYNGEPYRGVSTIVNSFIPPFDPDGAQAAKTALKMGRTVEDVQEEWGIKGQSARDFGHRFHEYPVRFYQQEELQFEDNDMLRRFVKWIDLHRDCLKKFEFVGNEIVVFSKHYKIAGTIDILYKWKDYFIVGDWKTNEKFLTNWGFNEMYPPFQNYRDSHLNKYSIQISLYELILNEDGIETKHGFICHIPPGDEVAKMYHRVDFRETLKKYLDFEMEAV